MSFDEFCQVVARRFIKTAIVIDDLADLVGTAPKAEDVSAASLVVTPPAGRTFGRTTSSGAESVPIPKDPGMIESVSHALNAMELTRGFAKLGVVCSIYRPEQKGRDEEIDDTVHVARHADIVVIDWKLGPDETKAKEIIRRILKSDADEGGRLRLIAIYTGEIALDDLLSQVLADHEFLTPTDPQDSLGLLAPSLRIVFLNKNHPGIPRETPRVEEGDLADRMVVEFAKLAKGIVPSVALGCITAIRSNTHRLLAKFNSGLDGVFAGHRAMLTRPEDAEAFMVDLVSEEIRSLLEVSEVGRDHAGLDVLKTWIADLKPNPSDQFVSFSKMSKGISPANMGRLMDEGVISHASLHSLLKPKPTTNDLAHNAAAFFYDRTSETNRANMEFARMSALRREAYGGTRFPAGWMPTLTLGSVVKISDAPERFYVCTQPLCDTVRIEGFRRFPLVPLWKTSAFSLVVRFDGSDIGFAPEFQPYKALHHHFEADPKTGSVRAKARDGGFWFTSNEGVAFEWIADLKASFAQRVAQSSAGHADRVGLDMYEWFRQQGEDGKKEDKGEGREES